MEQLDLQPQQTAEQQNFLMRQGRNILAVGATVLAFAGAAVGAREYVDPATADAGVTETSFNYPNANETSVFEFPNPATAADCKQAALRIITSGDGYRFTNSRHNKIRWGMEKESYDPAACKQFGSVAVTGYGTADSKKDHRGHGSHWRRNTPKYTFMTDPVGGVTMPDGKYHVTYSRTVRLPKAMYLNFKKNYYGSRIVSTWTPADGSAPSHRAVRLEGASDQLG